MIKYNIKDEVYFINKEKHRIDYGTIRKIIIENNNISYDIELTIYYNHQILTVEENSISKNLDELYQQLRDNIEEYFPTPVRSLKDLLPKQKRSE